MPSLVRCRSLLFAMTLLTAGSAHAGDLLRVMSFNVRTPADTEPAKRWPDRRDALVTLVKQRQPDVMGTQELVKEQADYIAEHLPDYRWFGDGRRGGEGDEHMGLFFNTRTMALIESGNYWLSETPDVPGSISWGHPYPRMVTWGLFERITDHKRVYVLNTHLPYRAEDEPARVRGARQILTHVASLPVHAPVVLTGDFNTVPASPTHAALLEGMDDAREAAVQTTGPAQTFHDFSGVADRQLDWILVRDIQVLRFSTLDDRIDGILPSDHFPVEAELRLPE